MTPERYSRAYEPVRLAQPTALLIQTGVPGTRLPRHRQELGADGCAKNGPLAVGAKSREELLTGAGRRIGESDAQAGGINVTVHN